MTNRFILSAFACMALTGAGHALAQAPGAATVAMDFAPLAVPHPTYVTIVLQQDVDRPAQAVWVRIGHFCDVGEWLANPCVATSGAPDTLGEVRTLANGFVEMLIAKTDLSYAYTQPVRVGVPFNAYHGALEVKALTPTTSRLIYTFVYDNSMLADDAARAAEMQARRARFTQGLKNMKILAEGRKLALGSAPPPAPR